MKRLAGKHHGWHNLILISIFTVFSIIQSAYSMSKAKDYIGSATRSLKESISGRSGTTMDTPSRESSRGREVEISSPTNVVRRGQEETLRDMRRIAEHRGDREAIGQIDRMLTNAAPQRTNTPTSAHDEKQSVSPSDRSSLPKKELKSAEYNEKFGAIRGRKESLSTPEKETKTTPEKETKTTPEKETKTTPEKPDKKTGGFDQKQIEQATKDKEGALSNKRNFEYLLRSEKEALDIAKKDKINDPDVLKHHQENIKKWEQKLGETNEKIKQADSILIKDANTSEKSQHKSSADIRTLTTPGGSPEEIQKGAVALKAYFKRKAEEKKIADQAQTPDQKRNAQIDLRIKEAQSQGMSKEKLMHNLRADHQASPISERVNEIKDALDPKKYISRALYSEQHDRDAEIKRRKENIIVVELAAKQIQNASEYKQKMQSTIENIKAQLDKSPNDASLNEKMRKAEEQIHVAQQAHDRASSLMNAAYEKSAATSVITRNANDPTAKMKEEKTRIAEADKILNDAYQRIRTKESLKNEHPIEQATKGKKDLEFHQKEHDEASKLMKAASTPEKSQSKSPSDVHTLTTPGGSPEETQKGAVALKAYFKRKAEEKKIADQAQTPDQIRNAQINFRIKEAESQGMNKEKLMHNLRADHQALPLSERVNEIKDALDPKKNISRAILPNSDDREKEMLRRQENIKTVEAASEKMQKSIDDIARYKTQIQDLQGKIKQSPDNADLSKQLEKTQKRLNSSQKEHEESSAVMNAAYEKSAAVNAQNRVVQSGKSDADTIKSEQSKVEKANAILDEAYKKYNPS